MRSIFALIVVACVLALPGSALAAEPVQVSGTIFDDLDRDGIFGPGEPGRPSVTVTIVSVPAGLFDATTTTAVNGTYSFSVASGTTYRLRIVVPSGSVQNGANPADFVPEVLGPPINFALVPAPPVVAVPATSPAALWAMALLIAVVGFRLRRSA